MGTTRSAIIEKARAKIVQGSDDPFWSYEWWNDKFHQACELIRKEIVDSELNWFMVLGATVTKDANDLYPLPSDCDTVLWVRDSTTNEAIQPLTPEEENDNLYYGYKFYNEYLKLLNYDALPATINIDYYRKIKEIGDWTGATDTSTDDTYKQYAPLNTESAARTISDLLVLFADSKDETMTPQQAEMVQTMVSTFVNKLGTRNKQRPHILGSDY